MSFFGGQFFSGNFFEEPVTGNFFNGPYFNGPFFGQQQTVRRDPGAGSGKYRDEEIWLYIEALKQAHRKTPEVQEEKPVEARRYVELYTPEIEKLVLEIKVARASMRPVPQILPLIQELDNAIKAIEDEEEEVIQLFLLH